MTSRRWPFTCRISISYFVIIGVDTIIIIVFMCNPAKLANCHKRKCSVCVCACALCVKVVNGRVKSVIRRTFRSTTLAWGRAILSTGIRQMYFTLNKPVGNFVCNVMYAVLYKTLPFYCNKRNLYTVSQNKLCQCYFFE